MTMRIRPVGTSPVRRVLACLFFCAAAPVVAHHSFAMYDSQHVVTIKGVVKGFQWTNPHAIVWLVSGPDEDSKPILWTIELPTSPAGLVRMGWDKRSLNPGDRVVMEINPLRSGEHGGSFKKATLVDSGRVLIVNIPPPTVAKTDQK
jgi:hypothetical protein